MIADVVVGSCSINLCDIEFNRPMTIPVQIPFEAPQDPTITFEVSLIQEPYVSIFGNPEKQCKEIDLYMFTTYNPPRPNGIEVPVSFQLATFTAGENQYSVFGQEHNWGRFGFSGNGKSFFTSASGPSHVGIVRSKFATNFSWRAIITSHGYTGRVTYNVMRVRRVTGTGNDTLPPKVGKIWGEWSIDVTDDSVVALPVILTLADHKLTFKNSEVMTKEAEETAAAFGDRVCKTINTGEFPKRFVMPQNEEMSLSELAGLWELPVPNTLNIVVSWRRVSRPQRKNDNIFFFPRFTAFDASYNILADLKEKLITTGLDAFNKAIVKEDATRFQKLDGNRLSWFLSHGWSTWGPAYDSSNFAIKLNELPPEVTAIVISGSIFTLCTRMSGNGCLRFIDTQSERELGTFGIEKRNQEDLFQVVGAVVRFEDGWVWKPINYKCEHLMRGKAAKVKQVWMKANE